MGLAPRAQWAGGGGGLQACFPPARPPGGAPLGAGAEGWIRGHLEALDVAFRHRGPGMRTRQSTHWTHFLGIVFGQRAKFCSNLLSIVTSVPKVGLQPQALYSKLPFEKLFLFQVGGCSGWGGCPPPPPNGQAKPWAGSWLSGVVQPNVLLRTTANLCRAVCEGNSIRQLLGAANAQTAHPATSSTAPAHQILGSANAETTPAGAPAAAADRTQRPDATCEGKNG